MKVPQLLRVFTVEGLVLRVTPDAMQSLDNLVANVAPKSVDIKVTRAVYLELGRQGVPEIIGSRRHAK